MKLRLGIAIFFVTVDSILNFLNWSTEFPDKKSTIIHNDLSSAEHRFKYAERMLSALP